MSIGPISPKAHGAWLGAGTGAAVANEVIQLIQTYGHVILPPSLVGMIYTIVPASVAALGAWLAPLLPSSLESDAAEIAAGHILSHHQAPHRHQEPQLPQLAPLLAPIPTQENHLIPTGSAAAWPAPHSRLTAEGQPHE